MEFNVATDISSGLYKTNASNNTNTHLASNNTNVCNKQDESARVVFLGAAKVGKTAIIQRFLYNKFDVKYNPTVEDIHTKKFVVRNNLVRLVLMDTAGSFDFPAMLRLCISKASAFVLVFSHDNEESLFQAGQLLQQIKSQRKDYAPLATMNVHEITETNVDENPTLTASPPITVVCNKSDIPLAHSRIGESAIMEWLLTHGLKPSQFVYASAKTNESILAIFKSLWYQNELTKTIRFDSWEGVRRASLLTSRPRTPPHTQLTDFSALSDPVTMTNMDAGEMDSEKSSLKPRSSLVRRSLKLNRRSSSKSNKSQSDVTHIDCVIS